MDFLAELSDAYNAGNDFGDDQVVDEKTLGDLHLGNAINLDEIEEALNPGTAGYNIKVNHRLKFEVSNCVPVLMDNGYRIEIGMLRPSLDFSAPTGIYDRLPLSIYKDAIKLVNRGLMDRGYDIPLTRYNISDNLPDIKTESHWISIFGKLLRLLCTRSEMMRGGTVSPYSDISIGSKGVSTDILIKGNKYRIISGNNLSICINTGQKSAYLGNSDSILLMLDTIGQRICLAVSNQVGKLYGVSGVVNDDILNGILCVGDCILGSFGNSGYDLIAIFEALCVSEILYQSPDGIVDEGMFGRACNDEVLEMSRSMNDPNLAVHLIDQWRELLEGLPVQMLSNVFCLYRCWGHPRVDIKRGMEKVHKIGTEEKHVPGLISKIVLWQFRKIILTNYYKKHSKYPRVIHTSDETSYVRKRIDDNMPIDDRNPSYNVISFDTIQICQIWGVPETYDICHILNDKAVSPNISELIESISAGKGTNMGVLRRGLVRWMRSDSINCKEFLTDISNNGLDDDSCAIGLYEKEREIKIVARMFSLMTEKMRYYFVLTEELIANHVLPYFPEITMKDSLNVLLKKIWTIGGLGKKMAYDVNVNIDFSKWNLNMRAELTNRMFGQMDSMFGFQNLIEQTHSIFRRSYIYSCSGKYLPIVKDGQLMDDYPMAYRGHVGGFEGLRQKGWTVATVCILSYIAEEENLRIRLMGQGDNQIVRIMMPVTRWTNYKKTEDQMKESAWEITKSYTEKMEVHFGMAKLPIKIRETWVSTRLFMYGKMMLHDGMVLPQWYKKILRSYAMTNEGQVTISGVIGTIATNMSAAAGASDSPDVMYIIYLIMAEWSLTYLLRYHPFTRKCILTSHELRVKIPGSRTTLDKRVRVIKPRHLCLAMMMIPTAVGGSVTIPLTGFIMRGFPDHASEGYAWLKMLMSVESQYQTMFSNWYGFLQNTSIESDMLIQSPWSINHMKPPTPGLQSREIVRDWLLSGEFSNNKFMREAGPVMRCFERKKVCESLMTDPMNPLVSSEIYNTFPHVYLDSVLRRVENTRTIKRMAIERQTTTKVISNLMEAEHNHIVYMMWRSDIKGETFSTCATKQARIARDVGWGRHVIGVTTPHPLELMLGSSCINDRHVCPETDYIYARVDRQGEFAPYLGSKIKVKVSSEQDQEARREPLITFGARVCRYAPWLKLGENYMELILKNLGLVCDVGVFNKIVDDDPQGDLSSGSVEHRFNPAGASEGCFINYAPQLGKRVYMSSDNMPQYGRGKTNFTLHFQALYCWIQYMMARRLNVVYAHQHIECNDCVVPTEDEIPDLRGKFPMFNETHSEEIQFHICSALGFISKKPETFIDNPHQLLGIYKDLKGISGFRILNGLQWTLSVKVAVQLMYGSISGSDDAKIEDLQEYPRIYGYKVYRDIIFRRTCLIMILIGAAEMSITPDSINLVKIRRYIMDKILQSPLGCFKGLGSLMIGRQDSDRSNANLFITAEFPESVVGALKMAKSAVLSMLPRVGKIASDQIGYCPVPYGELSRVQFFILLMTRSFVEGHCTKLLNMYGEYMKDDEGSVIPECRHRHTRSALKQTPIIKASMDKMFKETVVIKQERKIPAKSKLPTQNIKTHVVVRAGITSRTYYGISKPVFCKSYKLGSRSITLPTGSIYKWDHVMRHVDPTPFAIVIGDGTGGTSLSCVANWRDSNIFPCALLEKKNMIPQDLSSIQPGLTRGIARIKSQVMESVPDDIFHDSWADLMSGEIRSMGIQNVTLISDIEVKDLIKVYKIITSLPDGIKVLLKCYINDVWENSEAIKDIHKMDLIFSEFGNLHYGEFFLHGEVCKGVVPDTFSLRQNILHGYGSSQDRIHSPFFEISLIDIEQRYMQLSLMSRNISIYHLASLHIIITKDHMKLSSDELWSYYMQYVDTHYRTRERSIQVRDSRILTPALADDLTRAGKILLIAITGEHDKVVNSSLRVKNTRIRGVPSIKIGLCYDSRGGARLTKKDIQSSGCLLRYRKGLGIKTLELGENWEQDQHCWIYQAVKVRSFSSSLYEYSSSDCIDVYETD